MFRKLAPLSLICLLLVTARFASAQTPPPVDRAAWANRFATLMANSTEAYRLIQDFAALPPDIGYELLRENWNTLPTTEARQYLLANLTVGDHPHTLDMLHLGATDPSVPVQNRALLQLESFGFQSFVEDYNTYLQWHEKMAGKPIDEVIKEGMRDTVTRLNQADESTRMTLLNLLVRTNLSPYTKFSRMRRQSALDAGLPETILKWGSNPNMMWMVFQIIRNLKPGEAFLRKSILPLADRKTDPTLRYQALNTLASPENAWAESLLLKMLLEEYPDASAEMLGSVLAQIGDPHSIPTLISMLETDNTPEGARTLGNILTQLTGVNNGLTHDAAWWRAWWSRNSARFTPDVRALPFPKVALRPHPAPQQPFIGGNGQAELAQKPELHQIANDPKRAYWLISPSGANGVQRIFTTNPAGRRVEVVAGGDFAVKGFKALTINGAPDPARVGQPAVKEAPGLMVVMTGDGNGADAASFWADVAHKGLNDKYYIAVVVAPKWSLDQTVTWVTKANLKTAKDAKFPAETFVADIVKDVTAAHRINPDRIFLHGVGESGPVAYAASLEETTPFKGFYILSSAFKTAQLPPLTRARGRRYYLQNAQEDKAAPFWMASAAQKLLTEQGATAKLDTHSGYIGSKQDQALWDQFKAILTWLETGK